MGKFDVKSMFNKNQVSFIILIMKSTIPLEEKELIVNELEFIIQSKDIKRAEAFFEEISATHKITYTSSDVW